MYNISIDEKGHVQIQSKLKKNLSFKQSFSFYEGAQRDDLYSVRSSGAYIFRPKQGTSAISFNYTGGYKIFKGWYC